MRPMRPILDALTLVTRTIARAWRESKAAAAIEYGLILALVVIAMFVGLTALANSNAGVWNKVGIRITRAG